MKILAVLGAVAFAVEIALVSVELRLVTTKMYLFSPSVFDNGPSMSMATKC